MRWIYLSPHFDDSVLSCGGLIWEQVQAGKQVEVWTVCAGDPPVGADISPFAQQLHERWAAGPQAVTARRQEDEAAVRRLGAVSRHWDLPDCIYRRLPDGSWLVNGEDDLWQPLPALAEDDLRRLVEWLLAGLRPGDNLVSPLTLGNHVDHQLVRAAAERAAQPAGAKLHYYPDYPYSTGVSGVSNDKAGEALQMECFTVSRGGLDAWQQAIACYTSQISTFWGSLEEMYAALETYWQSGGGTCLLKP